MSIEEIKKTIEEQKQIGLLRVGHAVMNDFQNQEPKPPILTAFLRRSGFIETTPDGVNLGFSAVYANYQNQGLPPGPGILRGGKLIQLRPGPVSRKAGGVGGQFASEEKIQKNLTKYQEVFKGAFDG
mgnify:CR=1 FL=1